MPDPSWPTPPRGWTFWAVVEQDATPVAPVAPVAGGYGTDRGSWLASLRARAASSTAVVPVVPTFEADAGTDAATDAGSDDWALDGLLASTGRADL